MSTQLDLFGEVEAAERAAFELETARREWHDRFERAEWVAPWDTADGRPAGTVYHGWRCPDPDCGEVEPNGYLLGINHGWNPETIGYEPYSGTCQKLALLASQARYDRQQERHDG